MKPTSYQVFEVVYNGVRPALHPKSKLYMIGKTFEAAEELITIPEDLRGSVNYTILPVYSNGK